MIKNTVFNSGVDCSFQHNENKLINATIAKLTGKYPDLITIEPHKMMCNDDNCTMEINGIPLYRDDDHLNEVGSALLGKIYLKRKGSPFTATIAKGAKTTEHKIIPPSAI